jgi:hypothetical protein
MNGFTRLLLWRRRNVLFYWLLVLAKREALIWL